MNEQGMTPVNCPGKVDQPADAGMFLIRPGGRQHFRFGHAQAQSQMLVSGNPCNLWRGISLIKDRDGGGRPVSGRSGLNLIIGADNNHENCIADPERGCQTSDLHNQDIASLCALKIS